MINLLVRLFVRDANDVTAPATRTAYGRLASVASIACNIMLFAAKCAVGSATGSLAIVADAVNSITDAATNVVALYGFKLAAKPPDAEHPFGHGRYEYLAALLVSIVIILIGFDLARSALGRIMRPEPVAFGWPVVVTLGLSVAVKLWMARLNATLGKRIGSHTLAATATDSLGDAASTAVVLVCAIIAHYTGISLDGPASLAVGAFIMWNGFGLTRTTVDTLLGHAPDPALVGRVRDRILATPGVLGMHDLMVHDYGPGRLFASAHVEMAPDGTVAEDHELLDAIERDLARNEGLIITLHLDPFERRSDYHA